MYRKKLSAKDKAHLDKVYKDIASAQKSFIGYPVSNDFDYRELFRFLSFTINNVGDPFVPTNYHLNTHLIEREVLEFFAEITQAKVNVWGYVTNGGTEGNMYGLYLARELHPEGVVYYSQDVHYSIPKSLRVLRLKSVMIRSEDNGEIDYDDLKESIRIKREVAPIVLANVGTTMKGAVDDVSKIRKIMEELAVPDHYIHCDAALSGMILPFVKNSTPFDFAAGADSISISGHKFIGSPVPCGIVLAKKRNVDMVTKFIEYVGSLDTTLAGSRNGITPLFLWYAIKRDGIKGFSEKVKYCLNLAEYARKRIKAVGYNGWRNKFSTIVVFDRPPQNIVNKWQLAPYGNIAHLVVMPNISKKQIDNFVADLKRVGPTKFKKGRK